MKFCSRARADAVNFKTQKEIIPRKETLLPLEMGADKAPMNMVSEYNRIIVTAVLSNL